MLGPMGSAVHGLRSPMPPTGIRPRFMPIVGPLYRTTHGRWLSGSGGERPGTEVAFCTPSAPTLTLTLTFILRYAELTPYRRVPGPHPGHYELDPESWIPKSARPRPLERYPHVRGGHLINHRKSIGGPTAHPLSIIWVP